MSLRSRATSAPVLQVLLPLSLLLTALVPSTTGQSKRKLEGANAEINLYAELRCLCVKTFSGIHPSNIQNLEVHRAGPHCSKIEVIAKLKNGKEICLDPDAPRVIKILQKILENDKPAI
ncbi:platelet basic protein [Molossus nigricans]|uniref:C-X-C motif chemokine n=1 Tax=Molossus molossus TaxID=27622 RepID=A0A7J8JZ18_MOLMO|nr:platelet basic protein isoform X2 [Molossus molossus]KAF6502008.1 pro-platelet basic protein [Molossus molossus]